MRWGILFGVLVTMAACGGKSGSDDDDAGGSGNDAGQGGSSGTAKGGSGTTTSGGSSARGGTSSGSMAGSGQTAGGTGGDLDTSGGTGAGATGGTLNHGGAGVGGTTGAAGEPAGGSAGTGVVDPMCTDLATAGVPAVQVSYSADGTPPSPAGGTVQAGTYYLALETFYGASADCATTASNYEDFAIDLVEVVRFVPSTATSGAIEIALEVTSDVTPDATHATGGGTYSTSGSTMTVAGTCGASGDGSPMPGEYTATGDQIVLLARPETTCDFTLAVFQKI